MVGIPGELRTAVLRACKRLTRLSSAVQRAGRPSSAKKRKKKQCRLVLCCAAMPVLCLEGLGDAISSTSKPANEQIHKPCLPAHLPACCVACLQIRIPYNITNGNTVITIGPPIASGWLAYVLAFQAVYDPQGAWTAATAIASDQYVTPDAPLSPSTKTDLLYWIATR